MRSVVVPSLFVALAITGSACGDDGNEAPTIANPASVYCVEQGGDVEIVTEDDGEVGYCNLPDGRRIDEWEFYDSRTSEP